MSLWVCGSCGIENEPSLKRCDCCGEPRETITQERKKLLGSAVIRNEMKEDEDDLKKSQEIPPDDQDTFESKVGGALSKVGKSKIMDHVNHARKTLGVENVALVDKDPDYVIRAAMSVSFLDDITAKAWGIDPRRRVIVEFRFIPPLYLEDKKTPPTFLLYQSSDANLEPEKLKDICSFGLEWQLRARLDDWLNKPKHWPPKDLGFTLAALNHLIERINTCTQTCVICDSFLPLQMMKPSICDKTLCVHAHEQYGLGADVASEIRDAPDVVDLLLSFTFAACKGDIRRFNPFPVGVEVKYLDDEKKERILNFLTGTGTETRNALAVSKVMEMMPSVAELAKYESTTALHKYLYAIDPLAFPLLRWVITSNRAHLAKLSKADWIPEMKTEHQYMFLSSPPEKESKFQELKKKKGSFWAFHGSSFSNWHSILRVGLKNYSGTALMSTGAAFGNGIYLSPQSSTSFGYAVSQPGWSKSIFGANKTGNSYLQCLCLCEVINDGYKANPHFVVPSEDHVMTRYFFIYDGSVQQPNLQASAVKNLKSAVIHTV